MALKPILFLIFVFSFQNIFALCPNLNASFTVNQTSFCGNGPHNVVLTNSTTPISVSGLSFNWFIDGTLFATTSAISQSVSYNLSGIGSHQFTLEVIDPGIPCTENANLSVSIFPIPSASFVFPAISYCTNNNISFTNTSSSTNASTSYLWNFGNGATSTSQNPMYAFSAPGTYSVSLTVTNGANCATTSTMPITIAAGPTISISGDDGDGNTTYCLFPADNSTSETVAFSNLTTNAINYQWNFGDGSPLMNTTSTATFNHIYTTYGTYTATMTATSSNGCQDTDTLIVVFEKYVSSGLTLDITEYSGCIPHAITTLTNLSVNATTFTWNFGDGTIVTTNSLVPPVHNYVAGNVYTITLTAANSCNTSNATISPITIISSPVVNFTPSLFSGCAPVNITFTNSSTNAQPPNNYQWNMGNGSTFSNVFNPGIQTYSNAGTYLVQLIAGNACGYDTLIHTIVLDTVPTIDLILAPDIGCTPITVNPSATVLSGNNLIWSWENDGVFYSSNPIDIPNQVYTSNSANSSTNHSIQVTVSNSCGSNSDSAIATVHPLVDAVFYSEDTVCVNSSLSLNNSSTGSQLIYSWDFGDGTPIVASNNPSHSYSIPGTYNITLNLSGYCGTDIFNQTIDVVATPVISISASPLTICNNQSVTFANSSSTIGSYLWNFGTNASLTTSSLYTPGAISFLGSGTNENIYFSVNNGGCSAIDSISIALSTSPGASFIAIPVTGCSPVAVNLTNTSVNNINHTYTWNYGNGTNSIGYAPNNQIYNSLSSDTSYNLKLYVENSVGCKDSASQIISVYSLPIANYDIVEDTVCFDEEVNFFNTSQFATNYTWAFGDGSLTTIISPNYNYIDAGVFTVFMVAYNSHGCTDTLYSTIQVDSVPYPSFTAFNSCLGTTTDFMLDSPNTSNTYNWDFGDGSANYSGINPQHTYQTAGTFVVNVSATNLFFCSNSYQLYVTIHPLPVPNFSWSQTCLGNPMNFSNLTPGFFTIHSWDFGNGYSSTNYNTAYTYTDTGSYSVKLKSTTIFGCSDSLLYEVYVDSIPTASFNYTATCSGETTQFTNTSFYTPAIFSWNFGDGTSSTLISPNHIYSLSNSFNTTLTATYLSNGCTNQNNQLVQAYPHSIPNFSSTDFCLGTSTTFSDLSSGSPTSWEWIFGDGTPSVFGQNTSHLFLSSGNFSVSLVTQNIFGCSDTVVYQIVINDLPTASFSSNIVCFGENVVFTNNSLNNVSSEWNFGDGSALNLTNSPSHLYPISGTFGVELVVSNGVGCTDTVQQNVLVNPNPSALFLADSVCFGLPNTYTDLSSDAVSWLYDFGDGTFSSNQNETHIYSTPGTYLTEQLVTNTFGCVDSISIQLEVFDAPIADFIAAIVCEDDISNFQDLSTGTITAWAWDFDNLGATSTIQNPSYVYSIGGNFQVNLSVIDLNNCIDDTTTSIFTISKPSVDFTFDTVCHAAITHFTDLSVDVIGVTTWQYDFGENANQSTGQNPSYIYQNNGIFTVQLTAMNSFGCSDSISKPIIVEEIPTAEFVYDTICLGNSTSFIDFSNGPISTLTWDFGDGSPNYIGINPQHQYSISGQFVAALIAQSTFGCADTNFHSILVYNSPVTDFIWSQTCLGEATVFSNQSLGLLNNYSWDFGDGNSSNNLNSLHIYLDTGNYSVQLVAINNFGCTDSIAIPVYIDSVPNTSFSFVSMCTNEPTIFSNNSLSGPADYLWDFGDGNGSVQISPSHTYGLSGSYNVLLESTYSANGCSQVFSQVVEAYPHTLPNFISMNTCFENQTVFSDLSSNGVISWQWNFDDGTAPSNIQSPTHIFSNTGLFDVALVTSNIFGCLDTSVYQISIYTLPVPLFTSSNECLGSTTIFTNNSLNFVSTEWDFGDGSPIDLNISPTHNYAFDGNYLASLVLTSSNGCKDTIQQNIVVHPNPVAQYSVDSVCFGLPSSFNDLAINASSWSYNFGNGDFGLNPNESIIYSTPGTYQTTQVVTSIFGCVDSLSQPITVFTLPVANFFADTVCEDASTNFIDLSTTAISSWIWDFDDNGSTSLIQNPSHVYTSGGTYAVSLFVTNNQGCSHDTTLSVHTISKPSVDFTFDTVCYLSPTHFSDASSDILGITSWHYNFGDLNQSNSQNPNYIYQNSGSYSVSLTAGNSFGCLDTISHFVSVIDVPIPEFIFDTVCLGNTTSFTSLSTGIINTWDWNFGDGSTVSNSGNTNHTFTSAGNFLVTLTLNGAGQCPENIIHAVLVNNGIIPVISAPLNACENSAIQFNDITPPSSNNIQTWLWDFGDGITSALSNPSHSYAAFGNYSVSLTLTNALGCVGTSLFNISILAPPTLQINANVACVGQNTNLFALTNMIIGAWNWDFGDGSQISNIQSPSHAYLNSGNYTVSLNVIATNGCNGIATAIVAVNSSPQANFIYTTVCPGNQVDFTNTSIGNNLNYQWIFNNTLISNNTNISYTFPSNIGQQYFSLVTSSSSGCSDTLTQIVQSSPIVDFNFGPIVASGCEIFQAIFYDSSTTFGNGIVNWVWDFGDGYSAFTSSPTHSYSNAGNYSIALTVTTAENCQFTDTLAFQLNVYPSPLANFSYPPDEYNLNNPIVQFTDLSVAAVNWQWDFGDFYYSNEINPIHTYGDTGRFFVTQIVINEYGCTDTAYSDVYLNSSTLVYIPNSFTPDGNEHNPTFNINGSGIKNYTLYIFDRWGELLFQTSDPNGGWDGIFKEKECSEGIYVWRLDYHDHEEEAHRLYGHVTLLRE